ncbi:MAG: response regulator transcription factor [Bacteroidota bacterium]
MVEDESLILASLKLTIEQNGFTVSGAVMSGEEAIAAIKLHPPDVVIVDIDLSKGRGEIDGIETAIRINQITDIPIIFLTSYQNAHIARRVGRTQYDTFINKPATEVELILAIEKALERTKPMENRPMPPSSASSLFALKNGVWEKIDIADIRYIQAENQYLRIFTQQREEYIVSISLGQFEKKYLSEPLFRISRSIIVNLTHVTSFEEPATICLGSEGFPVGKTFRKAVKKKLTFLKS